MTIEFSEGAVFKGIELYNLQGELILREKGTTIDLGAQTKGIYLAHIFLSDRVISKKVIVQ